MRGSALRRWLLAAALLGGAHRGWCEGIAAPPYGGASAIPADEALGYVPLPEGDVFVPLLADPKATTSFASYVRGRSSSAFGTDLGSVGIGDRFPLARWGGPRRGDGFQVGLDAGVFAQFDMKTVSYDLVNADYNVGLPLTYRHGRLSARLRVYHQSSHLGDEYLLHSHVQRENLSYESADGLLSLDAGPLRAYGGGERVFLAQPSGLEAYVAHGGVELRQRSPLRIGRLANLRFVAAGDLKAVQLLDWERGWSVRAGFEASGPDEAHHASRTWGLMAEYYDGPSPYGQFFRSDVSYYGLGLHFAP